MSHGGSLTLNDYVGYLNVFHRIIKLIFCHNAKQIYNDNGSSELSWDQSHKISFKRGWLHQSRLYIERLAIVLVSRRRQRGWLMHRFVMVILNAGISYLINNIYVNAGIFTCCLQKASMFLTKITRISKNHYKIFLKILQASDLTWDRSYRCWHP